MKAIVFFEGKEVCQIECDKHVQFDNEIIFYLNDVIVGSFCYGYCFVIIPEKIPLTESEVLEWKAKITNDTKKLNRRWWKL